MGGYKIRKAYSEWFLYTITALIIIVGLSLATKGAIGAIKAGKWLRFKGGEKPITAKVPIEAEVFLNQPYLLMDVISQLEYEDRPVIEYLTKAMVREEVDENFVYFIDGFLRSYDKKYHLSIEKGDKKIEISSCLNNQTESFKAKLPLFTKQATGFFVVEVAV